MPNRKKWTVSQRESWPQGFTHVEEFLASDEQERLGQLIDGLDFTHELVRGRPLLRGYVQYGFAFVTQGRRLTPAPPFPIWLRELAHRCQLAIDIGDEFDQCIVTKYPVGAGIAPHIDADVFCRSIIAINLTGPGLLGFTATNNATEHPAVVVRIEPGELYALQGDSRHRLYHQVKKVTELRYSITLRHVK